jgi:hypothetical protein
MTLDTIFDNFTSKLLEIELFKRVVEDSSNKELSELLESSKEIQKLPKEKQDEFFQGYSFIFRSALDGEVKLYGSKDLKTEEMKKLAHIRKNKQYQWLLVDAYEVFEDFIEEVFAYIGYKDKNLWMMSDFGNISLPDIAGKDYTWFLEQTNKKRGKPKSILNHLREKFPKIQKLETDNKLHTNFKLLLILSERFRHIIVHKRGVVDNKELFIKEVLEGVGLYNNGNPVDEYKKFISQFFGKNECENHIVLIDRHKNRNEIFRSSINVLSVFVQYLIAHAEIIKMEIQHNISK